MGSCYRRLMMKAKIDQVFTRAARHYDLMNDLMSGGLHRLWKNALVDLIPRGARGRDEVWLADIAAGTGDIALRALARDKNLNVCLCDPNADMISGARLRLAQQSFEVKNRAEIIRASGEALPFADMSVQSCTMAFGIRNIEDRTAALHEVLRILTPGGRFLCLEFGHCAVPILREAYDFHSREIIPRLADNIVGDRAPYQYLVESIRSFPPQEEFAALIDEIGFAKTEFINLTGGIAVIYSGWRI